MKLTKDILLELEGKFNKNTDQKIMVWLWRNKQGTSNIKFVMEAFPHLRKTTLLNVHVRKCKWLKYNPKNKYIQLLRDKPKPLYNPDSLSIETIAYQVISEYGLSTSYDFGLAKVVERAKAKGIFGDMSEANWTYYKKLARKWNKPY